MDYETEWQFDAPDLAALRDQLVSRGELAGFVLRPCAPRRLTDRYLDTPDARLARAGYALRLRSDGDRCEATLKSLSSADTGPQVRREINQPVAECSVAALLAASGAVSDRARAVAGAQPLQPLLTVRTHRDVFQVLEGNVDAAEITLDDTQFGEAGAPTAEPLQRVEVELHAAAASRLEPLLAELQGPLALVPARLSKLAAGLGTPGPLLPSTAPEAVLPVDPRAPAVIVGQQQLQRQLSMWHDIEPAVRLGDDAEALHRLRVTGRRLIAILRILEVARLGGALALRRRMLALLHRLGPARDLDVQIAVFDAVGRTLEQGELSPLLAPLRQQRRRHQLSLLRLLDARRTQQLFEALATLVARTPPRRHTGAIAALAAPLLQERYRRLRRRARSAITHATPEHFHPLRLQAKKLRYIAEPLAGLYGQPMRRFLRRLQRLQLLLGQVNDAHHALGALESAAHRRRPLPANALFAMSRVAEQQRRQLETARDAVPDAWQRVRGRAWRRLRRALRDLPGDAPTAGRGSED